MSIAHDLLLHAGDLLNKSQSDNEASLRRCVSDSYYALFHYINEVSASLTAPNVSVETNHRVQRWFDHKPMKEICGRFLKPRLEQPLLGHIGESASPELQIVCRNFITLQEARHRADYDLGYSIDFWRAQNLWNSAVVAVAALDKIKSSAEANIFVLSLLLWKNWETER